MPRARANGVELEYETFGSKDEHPLLMIMGLGAQMQFWDDEFCTALATRKHYVIRFDNRDVGLSTWFDRSGDARHHASREGDGPRKARDDALRPR